MSRSESHKGLWHGRETALPRIGLDWWDMEPGTMSANAGNMGRSSEGLGIA